MSKAKPEATPVANGVIAIGPDGVENNNRILSLVTESLAQARQVGRLNHSGTNLDLTTFRGKALLLKAGSPGDYELKGEEPLRMMVHAYAFFPDVTTDPDSGEVSEYTRTVLFDKEGKTFRTSAEHGATRLLIACGLYSPDEWREGIPFIIRARMGKRGRVYHDIQIDTVTPSARGEKP